MLIRIDKFKGVAPRFEPHLLPYNAAVTAENTKLVSGALRPFATASTVNTPSKAGTKQTIFKYGNYWFHWLADVNAVRGPVASDAYDRVYFTGDGVPKMTANDIATVGGGTDYPTNDYNLGLPVPVGSPSIAIYGTPDPNPPVATNQEDRAYVYTYVSVYGEEGPPSGVSNIVTWSPGQTINISGMSSAPAGNYNITQKRIYRTNTGSESTSYQLVATIPVANTTYNDSLANASLGVVIPSTNWDAPPTDMAGLCLHPGGFMIGFSGKNLCVSEPYLPHAWPVCNRIPMESNIVAVGVFGTSIVVTLEDDMPVIVTGENPSAMSVEKLEIGQTCVSKRGLVDMGYAILYPAPDGLMSVGLSNISMPSREIMSRENWQDLVPSSFHAYLHDSQYVAFYNDGSTTKGFIFNPETKDLVFIDTYATAGFSDPETGKLYLQVGDNIVEWEGGTGSMTYTWKSKPFRAKVPTNLGVGQVFADSYPVTMKVYAEGVLKHTQTVLNDDFFRLPSGFRAVDWQLELTGTANVNVVLLANSAAELGAV